LLTTKGLFVSLRWFSLAWAAASTEEAAINCIDIKATKTNTVVITAADNLNLDILKLPNNNFRQKIKGWDVKIMTNSSQFHVQAHKLELVSQFQWVANLSLTDNGCCWCMILENGGPIYKNCSSFCPLCHGASGSLKIRFHRCFNKLVLVLHPYTKVWKIGSRPIAYTKVSIFKY
jgi:hypothetical protein